MLRIAIYSKDAESLANVKSIVQDFLIELKFIAKVSKFVEKENIVEAPEYDIYIIDMDEDPSEALTIGHDIRNVYQDAKFVYLSQDSSMAYSVAKAKFEYFSTKPLEKEDLFEVLRKIKRRILNDSVIIKVAGGERRIKIHELNYINITKRCLCYHLTDGTVFDGQTLRTSFEKAIDPLNKHKSFIFLAPSLLINLSEIKIIHKDNIVFENDDVLFFPMKQYDNVRNAWINYNRIID